MAKRVSISIEGVQSHDEELDIITNFMLGLQNNKYETSSQKILGTWFIKIAKKVDVNARPQ